MTVPDGRLTAEREQELRHWVEYGTSNIVASPGDLRRRAGELVAELDGLRADLATAEQNSYDEALRRSVIDQQQADDMTAEAAALADRVRLLKAALAELVRAASEHGNEHGVSGDLGARLSDARAALAASADRERVTHGRPDTDVARTCTVGDAPFYPHLGRPPRASANRRPRV